MPVINNRIAALRQKASLTRRGLAARLGTSPEQIERYEAGREISPYVAQVVADALRTSLMKVFPDLRRSHPSSDEDWRRLGFEPDAKLPSWFLTVQVRGHPKPYHYQIDKADGERIADLLRGHRKFDFITFASGARSIYVNVAQLQCVYIVDDAPAAPGALPVADCLQPEHASIHFIFRGQHVPTLISASEVDRGELDAAFCPLDCAVDTADDFISLRDNSGLLMISRRSELSIIEVPTEPT